MDAMLRGATPPFRLGCGARAQLVKITVVPLVFLSRNAPTASNTPDQL